MGKKVKEYKSGDFIFAKVKGYPAWPARVQKLNGKKYFVYFYGTGETANLPPNMIFDYAQNKDKFLTKTVKRRDFNDGVKQIEYDFANNVPLEQVIGVPMEEGAAPGNDTANDSAIDDTMDDSIADTTAANDTTVDETLADKTQNDTAVEDSDETGALVIDEGKVVKGKKSKVDPKTPKAKEVKEPKTPQSKEVKEPKTPQAKEVKEPKTPRGKVKKDEAKDKEDDKDKEDEIVSRSGRKIRPKRYIDEQTEENATLPSPASKKRRGASPLPEKEKADNTKEKVDSAKEKADKNIKAFNAVTQSELEDLKEPFKPDDPEKDNILIAYLPNGTYVGIKLFQSRPSSFKSETSRLQWDKQAASNAVTLKMQLERNQITAQSVQGQLVMELNLTEEEKATLDKERETEEKKSRVQFLKTEMKLIELDAKIKTCLCLEKADTELCLKLLDEFLELDVKPLMLLKHPTCLETVKRMRAYVGNTPSWDLSESAALVFSKQAHRIRKQADTLYKNMKELFTTPEGLSFWEFFSERVLHFKKITAKLNAGELLEMVHEPLELSQPTAHTMKAAIDAANEIMPPEEEEPVQKKKATQAKSKKPASTPSKSKRQSSRKQPSEDEKIKSSEETEKEPENDKPESENEKGDAKEKDGNGKEKGASTDDTPKEPDSTPQENNADVEMAEADKNEQTSAEKESEETAQENDESEKCKESERSAKESEKSAKESEKISKDNEKSAKESEKSAKENEKSAKDNEKSKDDKSSKKNKNSKEARQSEERSEKSVKDSDESGQSGKGEYEKEGDKPSKDAEKSSKDKKSAKDNEKSAKDSEKSGKSAKDSDKNGEKSGKDDEAKSDRDDKDSGEPRAKRSRESKKTEPPPRSPAKRKSKF